MGEYRGEGNGVATTLAATLGGGGLLAGLGSLVMNFLTGTAENIAGGYYRPGAAGFAGIAGHQAIENVVLRDEIVRKDATIEIEKVRGENALLRQEIGFERERRAVEVRGVYDFVKSHYIEAKKYIDAADVGTITAGATAGSAA
jgi:hypothetical protein